MMFYKYLLLSLLAFSASCTNIKSISMFANNMQSQAVNLKDHTGPCGSGMVIYQDNEYAYILTDKHVAMENIGGFVLPIIMMDIAIPAQINDITFQQPFGKAELIKSSSTTLDLALYKVTLPFNKRFKGVVKFNFNNRPSMTEDVYAVGTPKEQNFIVSKGSVLRYYEEDGLKYIEVSSLIAPGSSGGPLFNGNGECIGIIQKYIPSAGNMGIVLDASEIYQWFKSIKLEHLLNR